MKNFKKKFKIGDVVVVSPDFLKKTLPIDYPEVKRYNDLLFKVTLLGNYIDSGNDYWCRIASIPNGEYTYDFAHEYIQPASPTALLLFQR